MSHADALQELAEALSLPAPSEPGLVRYAELVALENTKQNLTGARTEKALAEVLFADALILAQLLPADDALRGQAEGPPPSGAPSVVDVGAGAGAPTLPLLLLRPRLRASLVEPRRLRAGFLRAAVDALALTERVTVLERRLQGTPLPPFDVALSRATFPPAEWLGRGLGVAPLVVVLGGADPLPSHADAELERSLRYRLPFTGSPREAGLYRRKR